MAYPSSLTLVTVSGSFLYDGDPESGKVVFYNGVTITNATTDEVLQPIRVVAPLVNGAFTVDLPASNDPDWTPVGFTWRVTQQLRRGGTATYNIFLPYDGGPVNLADLNPVSASPGVRVVSGGITSVNGDVGPTVVLTAGEVGAATTAHTHADYAPVLHLHDAGDVSSGTLAIGRVPTGSTSSTVALGNHTHTVSAATAVVLTGNVNPSYEAGKLAYDTTNESLTFFNNEPEVSLQIGQEEWLRVRNDTGSTIANGRAVYISGVHASGIPQISLARADTLATSHVAGVTTHGIENGTLGFICTSGTVHSLDTSSYAAAAVLLLSTSVAGGFQTASPAAPNYRYRVGIVTKVHVTDGTILVTPSTEILANGSANQVWGMNAAGTAQEYKTVTGSRNVLVTHAANTVTLDQPLPVTLTDAATVTTDASLGNHFRLTLGGNRTLAAPTNPRDGQQVMWEFTQDATGSRSLTFDAVFVALPGSPNTLSTGANKKDLMMAVYNSTAVKWYVYVFAKNY